MKKIRVAAPRVLELGVDELISRAAGCALAEPFSGERIGLCAELSKLLFRDISSRSYPELQSLAFWLRKAEVHGLLSRFGDRSGSNELVVPRGLVFHIPPSNVDVLFVYSWALSMLCGNSNIVRLPARQTPQTEILRRLLSEVLGPGEFGQYFVEYAHEPEFNSAFSDACDVRVVWGGDRTIGSLREFKLPVHAKDVVFGDRYSMSAISSQAWLDSPPAQRRQLVEGFFNDTFSFDQMACSSPRLLAWCGSAASGIAASKGFEALLAEEVERRGYEPPERGRVEKLLYATRSAMDGLAAARRERSPGLTVLDVESIISLPRDHCGQGLLLQFSAGCLDDLVPHLVRKDQTLTYFGFSNDELTRFARLLNGRAIDRIVPIGMALRFDAIWDGYDLLREFTRLVRIW